jgi:hypothetical protein
MRPENYPEIIIYVRKTCEDSMGTKNGFSSGQILTTMGGIISIISIFLPWFQATSATSSLSVNGLFSATGSGMLRGLVGENSNWGFQGLGVLGLGMVSIAAALILHDKIRSSAMIACGILIIGGGVVNLWSLRDIALFSGSILGEVVKAGAGYGLYVVVIGGIVTAAGGLMERRDLTK